MVLVKQKYSINEMVFYDGTSSPLTIYALSDDFTSLQNWQRTIAHFDLESFNHISSFNVTYGNEIAFVIGLKLDSNDDREAKEKRN